MGSNPIKSTKFYIMNKFYTQTVSKELLDAIAKKGFPYKTIPVGYNVFEQGGGYPEYATVIPTYAEVLDWLFNEDIEINIFRELDKKWTATSGYKGVFDICTDDINESTFQDAIEKVILLSIGFIEPLQAENISNGTDSY